MNRILKILPWKTGLLVSLIALFFAIIFSFYGLYTNQFYFFKLQNYLLPLSAIVHFIFLYVLWFKIREEEVADPQMRNLEYGLYAILPIYTYKLISTILTLSGTSEYASHAIPPTFFPIGSFMLIVYLLLIALAVMAIAYRKKHVGGYNFEEINQIDSWE